MSVAFLDLGPLHGELRPALEAAVVRVLDSGWFVLGPEVEAFEAELAAAFGAAHAIGVGNGLDAIEIALRARGIGPGDEVIVPAHTFIATWLGVARTGASLVPVDVDPGTLLLDPAAARAAVGPRTAAIVPVDLYGRPVDPAPIDALAHDHGLAVVRDAAQSHGAVVNNVTTGALGDAATFSFYPGKNLGALGDGGAITTDDAALAVRARALRNYGSTQKYVHDVAAGNSRLDELQAALLRCKLPVLDRWNARRVEVAAAYREALASVDELVLPLADAPGTRSVWHLFCVRHPRRDALQAHLAARGVQTLVHYPVPPHRSGAFASLGLPEGRFPVTEAAAATLLSLPIGPHLDDAAVADVVDAVLAF